MIAFNPEDLPNTFVKTKSGVLRGFKVIEQGKPGLIYFDDKTGKYYNNPDCKPEHECNDFGDKQ